METSGDTRKTQQFERVYTLLLLWLVAGLLLISILYTEALWWVKVLIASSSAPFSPAAIGVSDNLSDSPSKIPPRSLTIPTRNPHIRYPEKSEN